MHTALETWPDISYAVPAFSRYNSCIFTSPMTAAQWLLHYLNATVDFRLHFNTNVNWNGDYSIIRFADSNWASDSTDCMSHGGLVFPMGHNGGAISWQSRKQDLITLKTVQAKFISCSEGSCEVRRSLELETDIYRSLSDTSPLLINCGNQSTLRYITTRVIKARMKHINMYYPNCRDVHTHTILDYSYVNTNDDVANNLTNPLNKTKNTQLR